MPTRGLPSCYLLPWILKRKDPEAKLGEEYHVKIDVNGEQLRVGVGGGKVVRVVRKVRADFRVPQR